MEKEPRMKKLVIVKSSKFIVITFSASRTSRFKTDFWLVENYFLSPKNQNEKRQSIRQSSECLRNLLAIRISYRNFYATKVVTCIFFFEIFFIHLWSDSERLREIYLTSNFADAGKKDVQLDWPKLNLNSFEVENCVNCIVMVNNFACHTYFRKFFSYS